MVSPVTAPRDLAVYIDAGVTMKTQVINTVIACFAALRHVRQSLPQHPLLTVIRTLFITKLDQCNSVLVGTSVYLQDRTHNFTATGASLVARPGAKPVPVVCSGVPLCPNTGHHQVGSVLDHGTAPASATAPFRWLQRVHMEQSATRDSGLLLTFDIPVIRLTWRRLLRWSADVCSALSCATVLDLDFCKVTPAWQHSNP